MEELALSRPKTRRFESVNVPSSAAQIAAAAERQL